MAARDRGDGTKAEAQLTEARDKAQAIATELLTSHPELRAGSYSNAIEECVANNNSPVFPRHYLTCALRTALY